MKSLHFRAVLAVGVTMGFALALPAAESAVTFRSLSFTDASAAAANEGKLVFIDFYTTWCPPCKQLDAVTWKNADVVKLLGEKTVSLKIDAEKELDLARRFKVDAYPTLLLLKPDGTLVDRLVGFREPGQFMGEFNSALAGKPSLARSAEAVTEAKTDHDAVDARYKLGRELARNGDRAGALREFLWCYDEGMVQVGSFSGVRLSFLLGEIQRLFASYPAARDALGERCDRAEQRLVRDADDRAAVSEFAALCATLGEDSRMMKVFDSLPAGDVRRRAFGLRAFRVLLPQQRYADALSAMPYDSMARLFDATVNRPPSTSLPPGAAESMRRGNIKSTLDYIEVLAGAGDLEHARELGTKLLEYDATTATRDSIAERVKRAGQPDLLKKLPTP